MAACASVPPGTPVLSDDATGPHAELYVFNVSSGTMIPFRRHVTIDGFPLVSLSRETWQRVRIKPGAHEVVLDGQHVPMDATDGGVYYLAVGYRPHREWLAPPGSYPVFVRRISEADAHRLFTEMNEAK